MHRNLQKFYTAAGLFFTLSSPFLAAAVSQDVVKIDAGKLQGAMATGSPLSREYHLPRRRWAICGGRRRSL